MAISKAPILHGAKGKLDGIYIRQEFGNTILSSMPRKRSKSSRLQRVQNSFFHIAVKCLKYVPMYAQYAYVRDGMRSPYNMCVSALVNALHSVGVTDLTPNFLCLCNTLVSSNAAIGNGTPSDDSLSFSIGAQSDVTLTANFVDPCTLCVWKSEDGRYGTLQLLEYQSGESVLMLGQCKCCMVVIRRNDVPVQLPSSECVCIVP